MFKRSLGNHLTVWLVIFMIGILIIGAVTSPFTAIKAEAAVNETAAPIFTKEDASDRAKSLHLLPKKAEITEVRKQNKETWTVYFATKELNMEGHLAHYGEFVFLAADGSLASFKDYKGRTTYPDVTENGFDASKEKISWDQAIPLAEVFIKNPSWKFETSWVLNPYVESAYSTRFEDKSSHKIRFRGTMNGIPYDDDILDVFVDRITGEITSYQLNWQKIQFASPDHIISKEEAAAILFKLVKPNLYMSDAGTPYLVYALNQSYAISAVDGKYTDNQVFNNSNVKKDDTLIPSISADRAKNLLLSMYDLELKYYINSDWKVADLYYQLVVKPAVPVFYMGSAPVMDAKSGIWRDFLGEPVTQTMPEASDWLNEILTSPERITYKAAIVLDGKVLALSDDPIIAGTGTTIVPFRGLLEQMKASLAWDPKTRKVTAKKDGTTLELTVNSKTAYINGKATLLAMPAQILNSRVYVPAKFVAEAFGAKVKWDASSRLIFINTIAYTEPPVTAHSLMLLKWEAQQNWEAAHSKKQ